MMVADDITSRSLAGTAARQCWRGCPSGSGTTWAAYLHWTGHLMSKEWVADTNWNDLIMDSLNLTSTTPGGIRPLILRDPGHRHIGD